MKSDIWAHPYSQNCMILTPLRIFDCEIGSRIRLHLSKHRIVDYSGTPLINIYNLPPFFFLSVSDPIRTDLQPTSWELLCPFTIINFLCLSLCVVSGLSLGSGCRSWRRTAGRSVTSCGLILHLTACCVKPCSTTCPLSHLQPTLMTLSTPCPALSSACSTTLMPRGAVKF